MGLGGCVEPGRQSCKNLIGSDFFCLAGVTKFEFHLALSEPFVANDQVVGRADQVSVVEFDSGPSSRSSQSTSMPASCNVA